MSERGPFTITPEELEARLGEPGLRIVDASWYLPAQNRDAAAEYAKARIPGAVRFDIDAIADHGTDLPHMLPSPQAFAKAAGDLGISEHDSIIVYDGPGVMSAPRVWWTFRVMGARNVRVLDGGFDRWKEQGRRIETGEPLPPAAATFHPDFDASQVRNIDEIRANIRTSAAQLLDARSAARFAGTAPEPRPGLRSGHVPGSKSLPFDQLVENGRLKDISALRAIFESVSPLAQKPVITTCGSGVTAAVLSLALETLGHSNHSLYDGSWAEWGQAQDAPVATWE